MQVLFAVFKHALLGQADMHVRLLTVLKAVLLFIHVLFCMHSLGLHCWVHWIPLLLCKLVELIEVQELFAATHSEVILQEETQFILLFFLKLSVDVLTQLKPPSEQSAGVEEEDDDEEDDDDAVVVAGTIQLELQLTLEPNLKYPCEIGTQTLVELAHSQGLQLWAQAPFVANIFWFDTEVQLKVVGL